MDYHLLYIEGCLRINSLRQHSYQSNLVSFKYCTYIDNSNYRNKDDALMTGKRALYRRKSCTKTPSSVLYLVGIYTNPATAPPNTLSITFFFILKFLHFRTQCP